jgi:hypothetical protein
MLYILGSDGDCEGFVRWIIVWKQKLVIYEAYREDEKSRSHSKKPLYFSSSLYAA